MLTFLTLMHTQISREAANFPEVCRSRYLESFCKRDSKQACNTDFLVFKAHQRRNLPRRGLRGHRGEASISPSPRLRMSLSELLPPLFESLEKYW